MPSHAARVRTAPLPAGYQFGDARHGTAAERYDVSLPLDEFLSRYGVAGVAAVSPATARERFGWRAPHLNAAAQLQRRAGWNVIDGGDH